MGWLFSIASVLQTLLVFYPSVWFWFGLSLTQFFSASLVLTDGSDDQVVAFGTVTIISDDTAAFLLIGPAPSYHLFLLSHVKQVKVPVN